MKTSNRNNPKNHLPVPVQVTIVLAAIALTMLIYDIPGIRTLFVD